MHQKTDFYVWTQIYTITSTGEYQIIAYGAQGGNSSDGPVGGLGAEIGGTFNLTAGEMLNIYVGGKPRVVEDFGGGGGGTFVVGPGNTNPLVVAGGGGGAREVEFQGVPGGPGLTTNSGSSGGLGGGREGGGGGGGFAGDGADSSGASSGGLGGFGGKGFPDLTGGLHATDFPTSSGGFGGGGASGIFSGGGGGGYSGGNGGEGDNPDGGLGGGSFDARTAQILIAGENAGNSFVVITPVVQGTPEPASLAFVGAALVGIYLFGRKRITKTK